MEVCIATYLNWRGGFPFVTGSLAVVPPAPGGLVSPGFWAGLLPVGALVGYCARPPLAA